VTLAHIAVALVALAVALYVAGKLLPKREETEETPQETPAPEESIYMPRGPLIIDQEREWRAPYGGRRL
jgi:hypothetical protein